MSSYLAARALWFESRSVSSRSTPLRTRECPKTRRLEADGHFLAHRDNDNEQMIKWEEP